MLADFVVASELCVASRFVGNDRGCWRLYMAYVLSVRFRAVLGSALY